MTPEEQALVLQHGLVPDKNVNNINLVIVKPNSVYPAIIILRLDDNRCHCWVQLSRFDKFDQEFNSLTAAVMFLVLNGHI